MHTQTNIQNAILKNDLNLGIIRLGGNAFSDGLGERERERWGKKECVEMCCLCLQNDLKEA